MLKDFKRQFPALKNEARRGKTRGISSGILPKPPSSYAPDGATEGLFSSPKARVYSAKENLKRPDFVYFDTAATCLKPQAVINAEMKFLETDYANVHRGLYGLAERATSAYESARKVTADFLGAKKDEIIFTKNATEGLNILAFGVSRQYLKKDDTVVLSQLEHHANLAPWQEVAKKYGLKLKFIPLKKDGRLDLKKAEQIIKKAKVVAVTALSNVTGYIVPLEKIARMSKKAGAMFIVDACQAVASIKLRVKKIPCDALVFSGHKVYGPSGIGVLYLSQNWQDKVAPLNFGGNMISQVSFAGSIYKNDIEKFEAGTPPISQAVALSAALKWLSKIGQKKIFNHQQESTKLLKHKLARLPFVKMASAPSSEQSGIISFAVKGAHAHDVAAYLAEQGFAVRAGWHCAEPLIREKLHLAPLVRVSFGVYNTIEEVEKFVEVLRSFPAVLHSKNTNLKPKT